MIIVFEIVLLFAIFGAVFALRRWIGNPATIGKLGERVIAKRLRAGLPKDEYLILSDIYLPIEDNATTQIDHVVVSRYGIFVVESKNYSGWIFGDKDSPKWTQTMFRKKSTFQNPIRQNYRHICAIAENLGIPKMYLKSVVVFTGDCEFKTEMPECVVYSRKVATYICTFTEPIINEKQVSEIAEVMQEWNQCVTDAQRKKHVSNLRRKHQLQAELP